MADEGGGWDDLFAAAAGDDHAHDVTPSGVGTKRPALADQSSADDSETNHTPRKRKAKKKARKSQSKNKSGRHRSDDSAHPLTKMLESRMDVSREATRHWPAWVRPGGSLLDGSSSSSSSSSVSCQGYAGPYDASEDGDYDPKKKRKCSECGKSPLHHAVVVNSAGTGVTIDAEDTLDHLNVFLFNRNIRVCASLALAKSNANNSGLVKVYAKAALRYTNKLNSRIHPLASRLSSAGEAAILEEKFGALHRAVKAWKNGHDGTSSSDFDTMVRVIIASDAFYFRLYYLQLTASLPILGTGVHIPHPTTYFVADRFCWDTAAGSRCVRKLIKRDDCDGKIPEVVQHYSSLSGSSDHPLTVLKSSRFAETLLLFGDWSQDPQTKRDFARAVKAAANSAHLQSSDNLSEDAFYDMHECPAPQSLMDWRDVCRDHNCNLYAYATLEPNSVADVKSVCKSAGVLEAGAGTGYYANLLQAAGIDVKPSDIASTDASINEYHGSTPSFTRVKSGGIDKLKSDLRQFHHQSLPLPALLLCYPPPLSEMAHDALRAFIGAGGKLLVHIGEFHGLTGSPTFERLLSKHFRCLQRAPCLGWGTDASVVTVWEESSTATKNSTNAAQTLIPCSNCKSKPSTHRFRLIRSLTYCCEACYKAHSTARSAHAVCNMIPLETVKEASFSDRTYMMPLKGTNER